MSFASNAKHVDATIERAEGWEFAFEGGAHVLFRYVREDVGFVRPLP